MWSLKLALTVLVMVAVKEILADGRPASISHFPPVNETRFAKLKVTPYFNVVFKGDSLYNRRPSNTSDTIEDFLQQPLVFSSEQAFLSHISEIYSQNRNLDGHLRKIFVKEETNRQLDRFKGSTVSYVFRKYPFLLHINNQVEFLNGLKHYKDSEMYRKEMLELFLELFVEKYGNYGKELLQVTLGEKVESDDFQKTLPTEEQIFYYNQSGFISEYLKEILELEQGNNTGTSLKELIKQVFVKYPILHYVGSPSMYVDKLRKFLNNQAYTKNMYHLLLNLFISKYGGWNETLIREWLTNMDSDFTYTGSDESAGYKIQLLINRTIWIYQSHSSLQKYLNELLELHRIQFQHYDPERSVYLTIFKEYPILLYIESPYDYLKVLMAPENSKYRQKQVFRILSEIFFRNYMDRSPKLIKSASLSKENIAVLVSYYNNFAIMTTMEYIWRFYETHPTLYNYILALFMLDEIETFDFKNLFKRYPLLLEVNNPEGYLNKLIKVTLNGEHEEHVKTALWFIFFERNHENWQDLIGSANIDNALKVQILALYETWKLVKEGDFSTTTTSTTIRTPSFTTIFEPEITTKQPVAPTEPPHTEILDKETTTWVPNIQTTTWRLLTEPETIEQSTTAIPVRIPVTPALTEKEQNAFYFYLGEKELHPYFINLIIIENGSPSNGMEANLQILLKKYPILVSLNSPDRYLEEIVTFMKDFSEFLANKAFKHLVNIFFQVYQKQAKTYIIQTVSSSTEYIILCFYYKLWARNYENKQEKEVWNVYKSREIFHKQILELMNVEHKILWDISTEEATRNVLFQLYPVLLKIMNPPYYLTEVYTYYKNYSMDSGKLGALITIFFEYHGKDSVSLIQKMPFDVTFKHEVVKIYRDWLLYREPIIKPVRPVFEDYPIKKPAKTEYGDEDEFRKFLVNEVSKFLRFYKAHPKLAYHIQILLEVVKRTTGRDIRADELFLWYPVLLALHDPQEYIHGVLKYMADATANSVIGDIFLDIFFTTYKDYSKFIVHITKLQNDYEKEKLFKRYDVWLEKTKPSPKPEVSTPKPEITSPKPKPTPELEVTPPKPEITSPESKPSPTPEVTSKKPEVTTPKPEVTSPPKPQVPIYRPYHTMDFDLLQKHMWSIYINNENLYKFIRDIINFEGRTLIDMNRLSGYKILFQAYPILLKLDTPFEYIQILNFICRTDPLARTNKIFLALFFSRYGKIKGTELIKATLADADAQYLLNIHISWKFEEGNFGSERNFSKFTAERFWNYINNNFIKLGLEAQIPVGPPFFYYFVYEWIFSSTNYSHFSAFLVPNQCSSEKCVYFSECLDFNQELQLHPLIKDRLDEWISSRPFKSPCCLNNLEVYCPSYIGPATSNAFHNRMNCTSYNVSSTSPSSSTSSSSSSNSSLPSAFPHQNFHDLTNLTNCSIVTQLMSQILNLSSVSLTISLDFQKNEATSNVGTPTSSAFNTVVDLSKFAPQRKPKRTDNLQLPSCGAGLMIPKKPIGSTIAFGPIPWTAELWEFYENERTELGLAAIIQKGVAITLATVINKWLRGRLILLGPNGRHYQVNVTLPHPEQLDYNIAIVFFHDDSPGEGTPYETLCLLDSLENSDIDVGNCATPFAIERAAIPGSLVEVSSASTVTLLSHNVCRRRVPRQQTFTNRICAFGDTPDLSCMSKPGSLLACSKRSSPHVFYLVGLSDYYNRICGDTIVYTMTSPASRWIRRSIDSYYEEIKYLGHLDGDLNLHREIFESVERPGHDLADHFVGASLEDTEDDVTEEESRSQPSGEFDEVEVLGHLEQEKPETEEINSRGYSIMPGGNYFGALQEAYFPKDAKLTWNMGDFTPDYFNINIEYDEDSEKNDQEGKNSESPKATLSGTPHSTGVSKGLRRPSDLLGESPI